MPIRVGTASLSAIKVGAQNIVAGYAGEDQFWPEGLRAQTAIAFLATANLSILGDAEIAFAPAATVRVLANSNIAFTPTASVGGGAFSGAFGIAFNGGNSASNGRAFDSAFSTAFNSSNL
jgi:hypothetical protein